MKPKQPTKGQLSKENADLRHKLILMAGESNRILETFDKACAEVLDPIQYERVMQKVRELNKPDDSPSEPTILVSDEAVDRLQDILAGGK